MQDVKKYTSQSVLTSSPAQLVVMLYDGFARFSRQAEEALRRQDPAAASAPLNRADQILTYLLTTLDMSQGEIAANLDAIYSFVSREMTQARVNRDPDRIPPALKLMGELRAAWAAIARNQDAAATERRPVGVNLVG